jgi:hypothetical protein
VHCRSCCISGSTKWTSTLRLCPSIGLFLVHLGDDELRGTACRALNKLHADSFREYSDRMTPVAVIPMHSPAEAIAELEYAVGTLGLKAAVMPG